jgi:phosphoglycolate phosphatase
VAAFVNLIFDLDGTLTDPELGITRCMAHALERLGVAVPDRRQLRRYIGPPLREVLGEILATSDRALIERAVEIFREPFGDVGLYENELYSGTAESLERLARSGHRLFVATAKAEVYARRIIEHFGLAQHFVKVYGAALSGEGSHEAELLARLLSEQRIGTGESMMIGDRASDVAGARATGMRSVGVLWGYGTAEELAEADRRVGTWAELVGEVDAMSAHPPFVSELPDG